MNNRHRNKGNQRPVEIHIEELLLEGFSHGDRHRIAEAVQGELHRLVSENPSQFAEAEGRNIDQLDAGSFHYAQTMKPETIGQNVARSIHKGLIQ